MHPLGQHHQDFTMLDRLATAWLRPVLALFGLAGLLALGGVRRRQRRPEQSVRDPDRRPRRLLSLPTALTAYAGVPATVTITVGRRALLCVQLELHGPPGGAERRGRHDRAARRTRSLTDTDVTITVQDSAGQTKTVAVTVKDSPALQRADVRAQRRRLRRPTCAPARPAPRRCVATGPGGSPLVAAADPLRRRLRRRSAS